MRYGVAVSSVLIVLGLRIALLPLFGGGVPFLLFAAATMVSYHWGGRGPAAVSAVLGGLAAWQFFLIPQRTGNPLWVVAYWIVSAILIAVLDEQRRQRQRAESALAEVNRADAALRESAFREHAHAEELEAILEAVPAIAFISRDPECRYITGSGSTYQLLGLPRGSNLSLSASDGEAPPFRMLRNGIDIPLGELPMQKAALTGNAVQNVEFDIVLPDGDRHVLLGGAVPMLGADGVVHGVVAAFLDITDRKEAEESLRETQKLESVGLLAGGIAHDFNNLLTGIMGHASLIHDDVPPAHRASVEAILNSGKRAGDLTRQLLAYAGKGRFVLEQVNVSDAVREITELLRISIPKKVELNLALEGSLPPVEADPGQVHQIVMNLVVNAAESIPENEPGSVFIRTRVEVATPSARIWNDSSHAPLPPGRYVCLEVSDTGAGMDPEQKARIFDPFFTTKFTGRGLGLAAVAGILRSHGGGVQVVSAPGQGSSFRVFLPVAQTIAQRENAAPASSSRKGKGTVLVVDDEDIVLGVARAGLEASGFDVLTATDGEQGIVVFERNEERIDLVVLDLTMPVMSGVETFEALKRMRPSLDVILMSGHSEAEARQSFEGREVASFIQKPFTVAQLVQQVMRIMEQVNRVRRATAES